MKFLFLQSFIALCVFFTDMRQRCAVGAARGGSCSPVILQSRVFWAGLVYLGKITNEYGVVFTVYFKVEKISKYRKRAVEIIAKTP